MTKVIGWVGVLALLVGVVAATLLGAAIASPAGWSDGVEVTHGDPVPVALDSPGASVVFDRTLAFDVSARVRPDRTVEVVEDITQQFNESGRHGLERIIPLVDDAGEHAMRSLEVQVSPGTPGDVRLADVDRTAAAGDDSIRVRIGDPDTIVRGVARYRLTYVLEGAVTERGEVARYAFDAFSDWVQPVGSSTYEVTGPTAPTDFRCFQGPARSGEPCASAELVDDDTVRFTATPPLQPGEGFTVEVEWPASAFGPGVVDGPERAGVGAWALALALAVVGLLVALAAVGARRRRLRRAVARGLPQTFGAGTSPLVEGEDWAPAAREPPVELAPPLGLRPAEALRIRRGSGAEASRLLAATVVDLAAAGEVELVAGDRDEDWVVRRDLDGPRARDRRGYEAELVEALFGARGTEVRLGDRTAEVGKATARIVERLDQGLEDLGLLERSLGSVSRSGSFGRHLGGVIGWMALVGLVGAGAGALARSFLDWQVGIPAVGVVAGLVCAGVGAVIAGLARSGYTPKGMGAGYRVQGFERFFHLSEEMHARAAADAGLLRQYMGYAVAFDAVERWVGAFDAPDLEWMGTTDVAYISAFAAGSWFHRAAAPVSSGAGSGAGSSGFGGGFGGFSGGGSGGGGGGSW